MIKHKLFSKGEQVQALISTTQQPNVLIPVRATIYDVKFDDTNPQYQIRIKKFYDNAYFLKKNIFGGRFIKNFEGKDTKINVKRAGYSTVKEIEDNLFNGDKWKNYLITVDSVFCTKTRSEQIKLRICMSFLTGQHIVRVNSSIIHKVNLLHHLKNS